MAFLQVLQSTAYELGIPAPVAGAATSTDQSTAQLRTLLVRAGQDLVRAFDWTALIQSGSITTLVGTQVYPVFSTVYGFARFCDETQWNIASRVPLYGPQDIGDWAQINYGNMSPGLYYQFRWNGTSLQLLPTPSTAGQVISFYYVGSYWINFGGASATHPPSNDTFTQDDDQVTFPSDLLVASLKWRYLRAKKLAYDEEKETYEELLRKCMAQDAPGKTITMDPDEQLAQRYGTGGVVVPLTGFGS